MGQVIDLIPRPLSYRRIVWIEGVDGDEEDRQVVGHVGGCAPPVLSVLWEQPRGCMLCKKRRRNEKEEAGLGDVVQASDHAVTRNGYTKLIHPKLGENRNGDPIGPHAPEFIDPLNVWE